MKRLNIKALIRRMQNVFLLIKIFHLHEAMREPTY